MTGEDAKKSLSARINLLVRDSDEQAIDLDEATTIIVNGSSTDEREAIFYDSMRRRIGDRCRQDGRFADETPFGRTVYVREQGSQLKLLTPAVFAKLADQRRAMAKPLVADAKYFQALHDVAVGLGCGADEPIETVLSAEQIDELRAAVEGGAS